MATFYDNLLISRFQRFQNEIWSCRCGAVDEGGTDKNATKGRM